ncbi:hypothetical protein B0H14DRAFT_3527439 [Mycena olivaceomarginata]|nr:hypothetical protein B0H14DRAFT_3527439 [Mycena olivaceomarginata]
MSTTLSRWPSTPTVTADKQAVEVYKADIKAKLTRAGLIHSQPRLLLLSPMPGASLRLHDGSIRHYPQHRRSANLSTSSLLNFDWGLN